MRIEGAVRVEFKLKFRDLLLYNVMHQSLSLTIHVFLLIIPIMFIAFPSDGKRDSDTLLIAVTVYLLGWISQFAFLLIHLLVTDKKTILAHRVIELHDHALFEESVFATSHTYWPGVRRIVRRPGFIAVYISGLAAHVIPNRAFASKTERERFWTMLHQKWVSST